MKKIMFNDKYLLTESVLKGIKTQTRRIIKIKPEVLRKFQDEYYTASLDFLEGLDLIQAYFLNNPQKIPYKVGEVVAVAQAYNDFYDDGYNPTIFPNGAGWTNKMFVKPELMPNRIQMKGWRIESLQDISDDDCLKEGIEFDCKSKSFYCGYNKKTNSKIWLGSTPREAFSVLIDKVSGRGTWDINPYVFAYDFLLK